MAALRHPGELPPDGFAGVRGSHFRPIASSISAQISTPLLTVAADSGGGGGVLPVAAGLRSGAGQKPVCRSAEPTNTQNTPPLTSTLRAPSAADIATAAEPCRSSTYPNSSTLYAFMRQRQTRKHRQRLLLSSSSDKERSA